MNHYELLFNESFDVALTTIVYGIQHEHLNKFI